jgi:hypothetical protein
MASPVYHLSWDAPDRLPAVSGEAKISSCVIGSWSFPFYGASAKLIMSPVCYKQDTPRARADLLARRKSIFLSNSTMKKYWSASETSFLISLRTQLPDHTWEELTFLFNSYLPIERQRSSDGLKKKWKKSIQFMYTFPPGLPACLVAQLLANLIHSPLHINGETLNRFYP